MPTAHVNEHIRYEPDEQCPRAVRRRAPGGPADPGPGGSQRRRGLPARGGKSELYLSWAVFAALVVCGVTTACKRSGWAAWGPDT